MLKLGLRWMIVASVAGFLIEEFVRVTWWVIGEWGILQALIDGAVIHKLGELLIILPFIWFVHWNGVWSAERSLRLAANMKRLIRVGAVLNALALIDLWSRVEWFWWPIFLVLFGLYASWVITTWAEKKINWRGRVWGGVLAFLFVFHFAVSFLTSGYFIAPLPASTPFAAETEPERWQQDLEYLRTELPRLHKNAFHTISQAEFDSAAQELALDIPNLGSDKIRVEFDRLVALVGDGHTMIEPSYSVYGTYPVDMRWFADGLFVVRTINEHERILGAKLIRIGQTDIDSAYQLVRSLIPYESDNWQFKQSVRLLKSSAVLKNLGLIDRVDSAEFCFVTINGDTIIEQMTPITSLTRSSIIWPDIDKPLYKTNQFMDQWFEHFENSNTLYFKYNSCWSPIAFPSFSDSLWDFVDLKAVEFMIIDLRNNGGGNTLQFSGFFEKLKAHEVINQPGHLYVITNRGTFSSASMHTVEIKRETYAILAGELMGGGVNNYGDMRRLFLPNSELQVNYSIALFEIWPDSLGEFSIDIPISLSSTDYFSGHDPVLDSVIILIHKAIEVE